MATAGVGFSGLAQEAGSGRTMAGGSLPRLALLRDI